ncbi:discoidin domain-containing protein [Lentzea sp. BCCO 10_0061]|uniref:Discoidin domain-containing protein n=1 Tax=Lentzea sokolovensis TaxID=3095429 RepID=A0ABU4UYQ2_9PSEU|nr:discoidin domain-containing protein [Lentzea sp. BCCO 10_0061]MDX8143868.1 discoidin domain-containing protein [Lentzea sp. BCCO 10_0061]
MIKKHTRAGVAIALFALVIPQIAASGTANAADSLLSANKPTTVSSVEAETFGGANAVDGNSTTRWASLEGVDPQWIAVDLGSAATVSKVKINWEAAYASEYKIQTSSDGSSWTTSKTLTGQNGGIDETTLSASGRYVRIYGTKRGTAYGYSIFDLEVWGSGSGVDPTPPTAPTGLTSTGTTSSSVSLQWTAASDNIGVTGYDVLRNGSVVGTPTGTTFTDTGLASGTAFTYTVKARDAAGNLGPASNSVQATTLPPAPGDTITVVAAGDIASLTNTEHYETAKLIDQIKPNHVLTVGDNQYDSGTLTEFKAHYDKSWGKFKSITHPATGNHEWEDNLNGYKSYFGVQAYPQGKPYYSWEAGDFHFVSFDSQKMYDTGADSTQMTWLKADLAANTKACVVGYWHHPRFNSGEYGDKSKMTTVWNAFADAKADLVLSGHDHHYERLKPLNKSGAVDEANGLRSAIIGIGGDYLYSNVKPRAGVEKWFADSHGVVKFTLSGRSYSWEVIDTAGRVRDKAGPYNCR